MRVKDQLRFVRQNMKKNKTRIFMTVLATAIGCAFLIVLASIGFGLQESIVKEITEDRAVTEIEVHGKNNDDDYQPITDKEVSELEGIKNVKAVTRHQNLQQGASYTISQYQSGGAQTVVTDFPSEVRSGFKLSDGRLPKKENEIIVGYDFVNGLEPVGTKPDDLYGKDGAVNQKYRYKENLIGKTIQMKVVQNKNGKEEEKVIPLTVVGIGQDPGKKWVMNQNVFISSQVLSQIEQFTGTEKGAVRSGDSAEDLSPQDQNTYDEIKVYADNVEDVNGIVDQLDKKQYLSYSIVSELKQINMVFNVLKVGLILVGTIAIVIASIGIYNTMTMAVTERSPDIGIMKAIGANPKTIKRIFLLESSYIAIMGAIVGTVVAYIVSFGVNLALPPILAKVFNQDLPANLMFSYIPWILPIICIAICFLVTIASGMRPATRATKVDVLKALRREV